MSLNIGLGSVGSNIIEQQLDEEAGLLRIGYPDNAAAISGGLVIAADCEAVPHMQDLQKVKLASAIESALL